MHLERVNISTNTINITIALRAALLFNKYLRGADVRI
jgi:hypothetical protein